MLQSYHRQPHLVTSSDNQLIAVTHRGEEEYAASTSYRDLVDDRFADLRRPRLVTFYYNGDEIYPGVQMSITPNRYFHFNQLLSDVQHRMSSLTRLPQGVRRIYRVRDGERILSIDELDDGEGYACAGREAFKPALYYNHKVEGPPRNKSHSHNYDEGGLYEDGGRIIVKPQGGHGSGGIVTNRMIQYHAPSQGVSARDRAIHVELERMRAALVERERSREHREKRNQLVQWRKSGIDNPFRRMDIEREQARIQRVRQEYIEERRRRERQVYSRRAFDEKLEVEALRRLSGRNRGPMVIQNIFEAGESAPRVQPIEFPKEKHRGGILNWLDDDSWFYERYRLVRQLGEGRFSIVHEAIQLSSNQECAVKIMNKRRMAGRDNMVEGEVEIMKACDHPNIVRFMDAFESNSEFFLVMELVNGGDLFDLIVKYVKFEEHKVSMMIRDLAQALAYLHERSIVHRDMKPENILVSHGGMDQIHLKIGDFELATRISGPIRTVCGTPTYVAPEVLEERGYGVEVDCWALGVITYVLLSGFPPFRSPERRKTELFEFIKAGDYEYLAPYWDTISQPPRELIDKLLIVDPRQRYTANDVLSHSWITSGGSSSMATAGQMPAKKNTSRFRR